MSKTKQWINSNGKYHYSDIPTVTNKLPKGVYELGFDGFSSEFFLTHISENFTLPEKVYGIEKGLNARITQTFKALDKNFGVLLKGLKGTGKTVLAKQVCNELDLPVILVNNSFSDMGTFINSIDQDIIMLFDEFEKTYELSSYMDDDDEGGKKSVNGLLTLMDGVFTSDHKRLFILTTNKVYLPDAMLSRPSRIRYIKEFGDLEAHDILEILEDSVEDHELIPDLVEVLKELEHITVDIVKSVAEEANIYGTASKEFFQIFNVTRETNILDMFEIVDGVETLIQQDTSLKMGHYYLGSNFQDRKNHIYGTVTDMDHEEDIITIKEDKKKGKGKVRRFIFKKGVHVHGSMTQWTM